MGDIVAFGKPPENHDHGPGCMCKHADRGNALIRKIMDEHGQAFLDWGHDRKLSLPEYSLLSVGTIFSIIRAAHNEQLPDHPPDGYGAEGPCCPLGIQVALLNDYMATAAVHTIEGIEEGFYPRSLEGN